MENYNEILITGASGWLGKNLIAYFEECPSIFDIISDVRLFVNNSTSLPDWVDREMFSVYQGDLRVQRDRQNFIRGINRALIIHTAGVIHPTFTKEFFEINYGVAKKLLKLSFNRNVKRIITISSSSCVGYNEYDTQHFDEKTSYNPQGYYGYSKMLMEKEAKKYWEASNLEVVILRCPWFYGPYGPTRQSKFFRLIKNGWIPLLGAGNNGRSMIYIPKLCEAVNLASKDTNAADELYWIADENPYSYINIIKTIRFILRNEFHVNCSERIISLPKQFGSLASIGDNILQNIGLYVKSLHVFSELEKNIACTVLKAKEQLDYKPMTNLYKGMKMTIADFFHQIY